MEEEIAADKKKMIIVFKKVGNDIVIDGKVKKQEAGGGEVDIEPQTGDPTGLELGILVKYTKNPPCVSLNIGGAFYEICF